MKFPGIYNIKSRTASIWVVNLKGNEGYLDVKET